MNLLVYTHIILDAQTGLIMWMLLLQHDTDKHTKYVLAILLSRLHSSDKPLISHPD